MNIEASHQSSPVLFCFFWIWKRQEKGSWHLNGYFCLRNHANFFVHIFSLGLDMLLAFLYLRMSVLPVWNPFLLLLVLGSICHSLYWTHPNTLSLMRFLFPFFFPETSFCVLRLSSNLPFLFLLSPSYEGWHHWHVPPHLAYLVLLDPQTKAGCVSQHLWLWVLELCPQITIAIHVWFPLLHSEFCGGRFCVIQLFVLKIQCSLYHCMGSPFSVSSLTEMGLIPLSVPNSWRGSHSLPFENWAPEATSDNNLFPSLLMAG